MPSFTVFKGSEDGYPKRSTVEKPEELVGDQVLVKITASGLCGTDLHCRRRDMVLGHEGIGVVERTGPDVKHLNKGDRVGWGYGTDSCGHCLECVRGQDIFCPDRAVYSEHNLDQGSLASQAIWREAFLHVIPDSLTDEDAAPLQCAGATVFTSLYSVRPTETVGIMGMGGLGHLAIQFAANMGCRVVVLSGSDSKKPEAMRLGAHRFITMKGKGAEDMKKEWRLNRLLVCTSFQPDWNIIMAIMAPRGQIYPLTVSEGNLEIPGMPLTLSGISVHGTMVATRTVQREMLAFAAFHQIKPIVMKLPMNEEGIKDAIDRLESGKIYFRAVLLPQ